MTLDPLRSGLTRPPKYGMLMDALRVRIRTGTYRIGEMIPSEPQLQAEFRVSRVTVRRAIDELAREGLLRKEQGRGTYVHSPEITQPLNTLIGVTETMQSMGLVPDDLDVYLAREPVPPSIGALLRLEPGSDAWHLTRLRASEGSPICLIDNYIVPKHVPGLSREVLLRSLYATYEHYFGLSLDRGEELVEAKAATETDAVKLQVRRGTPILVVTRTTYLEDGEPIEVAVVRSRSDRYRYAITLTGRPIRSPEPAWPVDVDGPAVPSKVEAEPR